MGGQRTCAVRDNSNVFQKILGTQEEKQHQTIEAALEFAAEQQHELLERVQIQFAANEPIAPPVDCRIPHKFAIDTAARVCLLSM